MLKIFKLNQRYLLSKKAIDYFISLTTLGFFALALGLFLRRTLHTLNFFEFRDETEKFVAAQMIIEGGHLYKDIFSHHGVLPYIFSHAYAVFISATDFSHIRLVQILLALIACSAISLNPIHKTNSAKFFSAGVFLALLAGFWILQGFNVVLYHSVGGFLLVVPITQLALPLLFNCQPSVRGLIASGAAAVLANFTAYSFGISTMALVGVTGILSVDKTERYRIIKYVLMGALFALAFVVVWLLFFGDIKGFLVYHFIFNQFTHSKFIEFNWIKPILTFLPSLRLETLAHYFSTLAYVFSFFIFLMSAILENKRRAMFFRLIAIALLAIMVLYSNPRGDVGFQDSAFVIWSFAFFSIIMGWVLQKADSAQSYLGIMLTIFLCSIFIFVGEQVGRFGLSAFGVFRRDMENSSTRLMPEQSEFFNFIRSITRKEKDFLSLVFRPDLYVRLDRTPASGAYYYLPRLAAYNKNPIDGYNFDICSEIKKNRPAVIFFDDEITWDQYSVGHYEPCIGKLITEDYRTLRNHPMWYLRNNINVPESIPD